MNNQNQAGELPASQGAIMTEIRIDTGTTWCGKRCTTGAMLGTASGSTNDHLKERQQTIDGGTR